MNELKTMVNFEALNAYRKIEICTIMDSWEECRHILITPTAFVNVQSLKPNPENFGKVLIALTAVNKSFIGNRASERYSFAETEHIRAIADRLGLSEEFDRSHRISAYAHPLLSYVPDIEIEASVAEAIGLIYDRYYGMTVTSRMADSLFCEVAEYVDSL